MPTLHRNFTVLYNDTGAPPAIEALQVVVRTIIVPFDVKRRDCIDQGYNIFYKQTSEEQRNTLKRIATTNTSLNKMTSSYFRIPSHAMGHFILHQYLNYITRKATLLLQDATEEGKYCLYAKEHVDDTIYSLITKIKLQHSWLMYKVSHSINLWLCSNRNFTEAEFFCRQDHKVMLREPAWTLNRLKTPSAVRAFLEKSYKNHPLRLLKPVQRPFYPQPELELCITAFCMATHPRLGIASTYHCLPGNIIEIIIQAIWNERCVLY
jgi:hypothetical protein